MAYLGKSGRQYVISPHFPSVQDGMGQVIFVPKSVVQKFH